MTKHLIGGAWCLVVLSGAISWQALAQDVPTPAQATPEALQAAVQQNPELADVIRERIRQSGLSADQIRARLQATGYQANLLDQYLTNVTPGQRLPTPGLQELAALTSLGLPELKPGELGLPVDTGMIASRG